MIIFLLKKEVSYLSHRMNPSSLMVGTVCCGFNCNHEKKRKKKRFEVRNSRNGQSKKIFFFFIFLDFSNIAEMSWLLLSAKKPYMVRAIRRYYNRQPGPPSTANKIVGIDQECFLAATHFDEPRLSVFRFLVHVDVAHIDVDAELFDAHPNGPAGRRCRHVNELDAARRKAHLLSRVHSDFVFVSTLKGK